jgi:plasmid stability protein
MINITIHNLDDDLERQLRIRAAERDHPMEEEARDILRRALAVEAKPSGHWVDRIREIVEPLGGIQLELPPRGPIPEPPDFSDWELPNDCE